MKSRNKETYSYYKQRNLQSKEIKVVKGQKMRKK